MVQWVVLVHPVQQCMDYGAAGDGTSRNSGLWCTIVHYAMVQNCLLGYGALLWLMERHGEVVVGALVNCIKVLHIILTSKLLIKIPTYCDWLQ